MQRSKLVSLMALAGFACAFGAYAQDTGTTTSPPAMAMHKHAMHMMAMQGRHDMKVTVTSVDKQTGIVEAKAGDMDLRVHFPPSALTDVNNGDTITLHLGFTKDKK